MKRLLLLSGFVILSFFGLMISARGGHGGGHGGHGGRHGHGGHGGHGRGHGHGGRGYGHGGRWGHGGWRRGGWGYGGYGVGINFGVPEPIITEDPPYTPAPSIGLRLGY